MKSFFRLLFVLFAPAAFAGPMLFNLGSWSLFRAPASKSPAELEVYSATESEQSSNPPVILKKIQSQTMVPKTKPKASNGTLGKSASTVVQTSVIQPSAGAGYDPVPEEQMLPLLRRLQLVERLILKHKRAYDYRAMTTLDLERILRELESQSELQQRLRTVGPRDLILEPRVGSAQGVSSEIEPPLPPPPGGLEK